MHELYLWPADAVKAGTASIMCSYNRVNQKYACQNSALLNGLLKRELGFQGYVGSDYLTVHADVASAMGGLDVTMPGPIDLRTIRDGTSYFGGNITRAVNNGSLPITRVDDIVRRVMVPYFLLGQDNRFPTPDPSNRGVLTNMYGLVTQGQQPIARDV